MSYLHEFDAWLESRLNPDGLLDDHLNKLDEAKIASLKRDIKGKVLESYRNGRTDCLKYLYGVLKKMSDSNGTGTDEKQSGTPRK